jgi:hypothetical protein
MSVDLTWFVGKQLIDTAKKDNLWSFVFSDGGSVVTESGWRLISKEGIGVASEDHGHTFGLKGPVDACTRVLAATKGKKILEVRIAERTSDLLVLFEQEVSLEFLNLSCGYESWRAGHGSEEVICMGGGQLALHPNKKQGS